MPPSATAPVYKEKVYVKALRMPKDVNLNFKNDDYFAKKKIEAKNNNISTNNVSKESTVSSISQDKQQNINVNTTTATNIVSKNNEAQKTSNNIENKPKQAIYNLGEILNTQVEKDNNLNINAKNNENGFSSSTSK